MGADLNRIAVVGTTGSGKSTFSRRLSGALSLPHIELDALSWKRNWEQTTDEEFFSAVSSAVSQPRWIVDGNYSRARHIIWSRATTLIWLDYPLRRTFPRLLWRTVRRIWTQEEIFNGNRETFSEAFLSRKSILLWALQSAPRHTVDYPQALASEFSHLCVHRFKCPADAERFARDSERAA